MDLGDLGEAPVARIWLRRGSRVSAHEVQEWVNSRVAAWKQLYRVTIAGYE